MLDPETGEVAWTVVVDEFVVDLPCTAEGNVPAEQGHLVGVRLRVVTGAAAPLDLTLGAASFGFTDAAGVAAPSAATAAADACLTDAEELPAAPLAPASEYAGTVVLDVPSSAGTVTYRPSEDAAGGRWAF